MMKCPKCETENNEKAKFCIECATSFITPIETVIEKTIDNNTQLEELKTALKDKYEILREIGRGGMGIVYECREISLDRIVALKVLPRELTYDKQFVERFKSEIKILAKIEHPNIIPLITADEANGFIYFTMKYVKGRNLADLIKEKGELNPKEAMKISLQIAQALAYAHESNVIHRDLKPENVMIDNHGHIYIMDFGIAHVLDSTRVTRTGSAIGTPEYMSPEQCSGESEPDARSDIYSLGILMYEMLTGSVPFKGETTAVMYQHVNIEPAPLMKMARNVPSKIISIVDSCIEKKPERRPQSAGDLISLITEVSENKKNKKKFWSGRDSKLMPKPEEKSSSRRIKKRIIKIAIAVIGIFTLHIAITQYYFLVDILPAFYLKSIKNASYYKGGNKFVEYFYNRCNEIDEKDYKKAIEYCTRALTINPNFKDGYHRRGYARFYIDDYDGAINDLTMAIKLEPNDTMLYSHRARVKGMKGDYNGALIDFQLAIKINPDDPNIYNQRSLVECKYKNYNEALIYSQLAIKTSIDRIMDLILGADNKNVLFQDDETKKNFYGWSGMIGDINYSIKYSKKLSIEQYKKLRSVYFKKLVEPNFKNKEWISNINSNIYNEIENLGNYYYNIARIKYEKGDLSKALEDYSKSIEIDPKNAEAYFYRGMAKHDLSDVIGAKTDYTRAIDIDPEYLNEYIRLGDKKIKKGNLSDAIIDYTRAIDLNPKNAEAYKKRAEVKKQNGDETGANADMEKWKSFK